MDLLEFFNGRNPYNQHLGIRVTDIGDGRATGRLEIDDRLSSNETNTVAHGGAHMSLADTVGSAALASVVGEPRPTIDMRIDFLRPVSRTLTAEGEVVRVGGETGVVDVRLDAGAQRVAVARGTYKTSDLPEGALWET